MKEIVVGDWSWWTISKAYETALAQSSTKDVLIQTIDFGRQVQSQDYRIECSILYL